MFPFSEVHQWQKFKFGWWTCKLVLIPGVTGLCPMAALSAGAGTTWDGTSGQHPDNGCCAPDPTGQYVGLPPLGVPQTGMTGIEMGRLSSLTNGDGSSNTSSKTRLSMASTWSAKHSILLVPLCWNTFLSYLYICSISAMHQSAWAPPTFPMAHSSVPPPSQRLLEPVIHQSTTSTFYDEETQRTRNGV